MGERVKLPLELRGRWRVERADGARVWFEARLSRSVHLSSLRRTHWAPAFFPSREPLRGEVDFRLRYHGEDRFTWSFNGQAPQGSMLGDGLALAQLSLDESSVPRIPAERAKLLAALPLVDGRRTLGQIARRLKGMSYPDAVRRVKSLCLREGLVW